VKIQRLLLDGALFSFAFVPVNAQANSVITRAFTTAPRVSIETSLYLPAKTPASAINRFAHKDITS